MCLIPQNQKTLLNGHWLPTNRFSERRVACTAVRLLQLVCCCRGGDLESAFGLGASDRWWVRAQHQFTVYVVPWAFRAAALGSALLGALILWGEITAGFKTKLSPLYFMVVAIENEFCAQVCLRCLVQSVRCTRACVPLQVKPKHSMSTCCTPGHFPLKQFLLRVCTAG
jgi:hypothetical protein